MALTQGTPSPKGFEPWSDDDEARLIELREAGKNWAVVAKALGRTQASVESRYATLVRRTKLASERPVSAKNGRQGP